MLWRSKRTHAFLGSGSKKLILRAWCFTTHQASRCVTSQTFFSKRWKGPFNTITQPRSWPGFRWFCCHLIPRPHGRNGFIGMDFPMMSCFICLPRWTKDRIWYYKITLTYYKRTLTYFNKHENLLKPKSIMFFLVMTIDVYCQKYLQPIIQIKGDVPSLSHEAPHP